MLPRPLSAKERRALAVEDERDRVRHERPNEDPDRPHQYDDCTQSKYRTHRMVAARGVVRCEFCSRLERDCRRRDV